MDARTAFMESSHLPASTRWSITDRLEAPVKAIGFWAAMWLPVSYLSLLASGIDSQAGLGLFLGLFGLHVIALVLGHGYRPPGAGRSATEPR